MSLRKRIQILLVFLVGMPLLLLLFESYQTGRRMLVAQLKQETLQIAHLETAQMDLTFDPARIITDGLVRALETAPLLEKATIRRLLQRTLHDSPNIYGAAVAFDPALTPLGRFAPYVCRSNGTERETTLSYEYSTWEWYRLPVTSGRGRWIKPYFGEGGQALMVTYAAPVRHNGRIIGVAAVDLDLAGLLKRLQFLKPGDGTVYLVNRAGHILAHPDLEALAELPGKKGLGELDAVMRHRGLDTVKMADPVTHRKSWVVENPIPSLAADRGGEDWSLVVSWPLDKRLAPLTGMGRRMLVLYLFLGGAALWFLNRTFHDTVTRPLHRLSEQARSYAMGDFATPSVFRHEASELRELENALNSLGNALNEKNRRETGERGEQQ